MLHPYLSCLSTTQASAFSRYQTEIARNTHLISSCLLSCLSNSYQLYCALRMNYQQHLSSTFFPTFYVRANVCKIENGIAKGRFPAPLHRLELFYKSLQNVNFWQIKSVDNYLALHCNANIAFRAMINFMLKATNCSLETTTCVSWHTNQRHIESYTCDVTVIVLFYPQFPSSSGLAQ